MLNSEELKEIAALQGNGGYFVSLYLNVNPLANTKGDYAIHTKNMLKEISSKVDKEVLKEIRKDIENIESFIIGNRREFKRGLAVISSSGKSFWKVYNLAVPLKNELIVDKTPHIEPLLGVLADYQGYAVVLVDKESARFFLVHLGEIEEYEEIHTPDIPGRHKKGGWFALSQNHYERHVEYHVSLHIKDVMKRIESFLSAQRINMILIGGSREAAAKVIDMLPKSVGDRVAGRFQSEISANINEILERVMPLIQKVEKEKEDRTVSELLANADKGGNAVMGMEGVLNALQQGRVMKLVFARDFQDFGYACKNCASLIKPKVVSCPYCSGNVEEVNCLVDLVAQKAIENGALVEVISGNKRFLDAGGIGAFLRF